MKLFVNGLLLFQLNGQHFDDKDTEKMEAFAMFCGIGIHNTKTYESTCKLMAKQVERKRENKTLIKYWKFSFTASCPGLLELPRNRHGQRHELAGEGGHTPGGGVQPLQVSKKIIV